MKVLIVEDEHMIAQSLKKGLTQELFTVDVAYSGLEGYDLASEGTYDVIVLDLMLPDMDGLSICRELRKHHIHTPIIMLTAKSQLQDKIQGLNTGADDYLTKPFSFEELLARIRALTRRPPALEDPTLKVADLTLNPHTHYTERAGKEVSLHAKEFALLEYLMRHANTICTKDQIIEHVWNYETSILPNTIEVYIKNLRQKIDLPYKKSPPLIHTIRGFGYKLGEAK